MTAEVYEEVAYVADCDDCYYRSELFETRLEAERDAESHEDWCDAGDDERTPREKFQDALDQAWNGVRR